jgi:hypothetical protein
MICIFCSRIIADMEEPVTVKHLAIGLPFGPKDISGVDVVNVLLCSQCTDKLMDGLKASRLDAAKRREQARENETLQAARNKADEQILYGDAY